MKLYHPRPSTDARVFAWLLAFIVAIAALSLLAGCSALDSPAKRYARTLTTYSTLKATVSASYDAKLISDRQMIELEPLWDAGDRQVTILQADYREGRPLSATALDTLGNVVETIREWLAITKARK